MWPHPPCRHSFYSWQHIVLSIYDQQTDRQTDADKNNSCWSSSCCCWYWQMNSWLSCNVLVKYRQQPLAAVQQVVEWHFTNVWLYLYHCLSLALLQAALCARPTSTDRYTDIVYYNNRHYHLHITRCYVMNGAETTVKLFAQQALQLFVQQCLQHRQHCNCMSKWRGWNWQTSCTMDINTVSWVDCRRHCVKHSQRQYIHNVPKNTFHNNFNKYCLIIIVLGIFTTQNVGQRQHGFISHLTYILQLSYVGKMFNPKITNDFADLVEC